MPSTARRRLVPGALVLLVGLGMLVGAAGGIADLASTEYEYSISPIGEETHFHRAVYDVETLSAPAADVVAAARNVSGETDVDRTTLEAASEFDAAGGSYLLVDDGTYDCFEVSHSEPAAVSLDPGCRDLVDGGPVVHRFSNLSMEARSIVRDALAAPDGELTRGGAAPPEFESATDVVELNHGYYNVRYRGEYYQLAVFSGGGIGTALFANLLLFVGLVGLIVAGLGLVSLEAGIVRFPTALLAGIATVGIPIGLASFGVLAPDSVASNLVGLGVAAVTVACGVWGLLFGLDVE